MRLRIEDHQGIETRQMTEKGKARRHHGEDPHRRLLRKMSGYKTD